MRRSGLAHFLVLASAAAPGCAVAAPLAGLAISSDPTRDVACSAGVCTSAAQSAVLNVGDLVAMLAAGPVVVKTAARGPDIVVDAPITWSGTNTLSLEAYHSIHGNRQVLVPAGAGLQLLVNGHAIPPGGMADGTLSFGPHGHVTFASLSSVLAINGLQYTLVNDLSGLAAAVYSGLAIALAADYDARADGVYTRAPVSTYYAGNFEGLGNRVRGLRINSLVPGDYVGLFSVTGGSITNLRLDNVVVKGVKGARVGGLVGDSGGVLQGIDVSGTIQARDKAVAGGVVGLTVGTVVDCASSASVKVGSRSFGGGVIGQQEAGAVSLSHGDGSVSGGDASYVGGLVGVGAAPVSNTYATGAVSGGLQSVVGGLVGMPSATLSSSYASGAINSISPSLSGGFAGEAVDAPVCSAACYWDTTTSGTSFGIAGGNIGSIQPLTTIQLQEGLPAGFDSTVWGESPAVNGGLPYLLSNQPH